MPQWTKEKWLQWHGGNQSLANKSFRAWGGVEPATTLGGTIATESTARPTSATLGGLTARSPRRIRGNIFGDSGGSGYTSSSTLGGK